MKFDITHSDSASSARAGVIETDRGQIETPVFMPVGTVGTVKAVEQTILEKDINAQIILGNTYHLYLRPGMDVLLDAGGLHKFIDWDRPMLTDSGGYQVYSLAAQRKITDEGVTFKSHIDGSPHLFTPENVVDIQRQIGSDIMMVLDECTPYPCEKDYAAESLKLTHAWALRCKKRFEETSPLYEKNQTLFPIVQGSVYKDLRMDSAKAIADMEFEGNAIGGLSVGEPAEMMYEMTGVVTEILPKDKPRYLMGVGTPDNLLENIALGVDMFDCVLPTRNARHGLIYTRKGIRNLKNAKYEKDHSPMDPDSDLWIDQKYSLSYLRHLFKSNEYLALQLSSIHNLYFYSWLMGEARKHIIEGDFLVWKNEMVGNLQNRL